MQRLVRRGEGKGQASVVRYRRAMVILASAGGNTVPVIARLVQTVGGPRPGGDPPLQPTWGWRAWTLKWAGGRPRRITTDDEAFIVETATTRPEKLGRPFTRWSIRKLVAVPGRQPGSPSRKIGRERLRADPRQAQGDVPADQDLEGVQRPRAGRQVGPDRVRHGTPAGPLLRVRRVRAVGDPSDRRLLLGGAQSSPSGCGRTTTSAAGCDSSTPVYSLGDDTMWGVVPIAGSRSPTPSPRSRRCRAARPDGAPIYVILDNLSAHKAKKIKRVGATEQRRVVLHADLQLVGQPDRVSLRAAARVRVEQLRSRQPHRAHPPHPLLPPAGATPTPATRRSCACNASVAPRSAPSSSGGGVAHHHSLPPDPDQETPRSASIEGLTAPPPLTTGTAPAVRPT